MTQEVLSTVDQQSKEIEYDFKRLRLFGRPGTGQTEVSSIGLSSSALRFAHPIVELLDKWGHFAKLEESDGSMSDYLLQIEPPLPAGHAGELAGMAVQGGLVRDWAPDRLNGRQNGVIVIDNRHYLPANPIDSHNVLDSTLMRELAEQDASARLSA